MDLLSYFRFLQLANLSFASYPQKYRPVLDGRDVITKKCETEKKTYRKAFISVQSRGIRTKGWLMMENEHRPFSQQKKHSA